jgi:hypothetical protein
VKGPHPPITITIIDVDEDNQLSLPLLDIGLAGIFMKK